MRGPSSAGLVFSALVVLVVLVVVVLVLVLVVVLVLVQLGLVLVLPPAPLWAPPLALLWVQLVPEKPFLIKKYFLNKGGSRKYDGKANVPTTHVDLLVLSVSNVEFQRL